MSRTLTPHLCTPDLRADFPLLERVVNDKRLVYLDSTATSLKPRVVLDAMRDYDERVGANVNRASRIRLFSTRKCSSMSSPQDGFTPRSTTVAPSSTPLLRDERECSRTIWRYTSERFTRAV
ncbi:MAG: aminotransferase class V-fold PLP-dependent enzyme [Pleurocapsa sp. SU_196_0]|nr:aminotransferase class V-fold PLP-dependent enzyme [Pleurocapsa sp. SU_196_0]